MRILNLTKGSKMISLSSTDVILRPQSLSVEFGCSENIFRRLIQTPNYHNIYRFIMTASERTMLDSNPCLPQVIITIDEANDIIKKMEQGIMPNKLRMDGSEIIEPKGEPEKVVPELKFDRNEVTFIESKKEGFVAPTLINPSNVKIDWSSKDESVATVQEGKLDILKSGSTVITAISKESKKYLSTEVSYDLKVELIKADEPKKESKKGK